MKYNTAEFADLLRHGRKVVDIFSLKNKYLAVVGIVYRK